MTISAHGYVFKGWSYWYIHFTAAYSLFCQAYNVGFLCEAYEVGFDFVFPP